MKARQRIQNQKNDYLSSKKSKTMEAKLRLYKEDNDELRDMNNNLEIRIKIHEIQKEFKEREIFDQKNDIENLSAKIEELKDEKDFNQRLKN